jgi:hypothetical protein
VWCTIGSRGEVPGKRKPVIRDGDDNDDDMTTTTTTTTTTIIIIIIIHV